MKRQLEKPWLSFSNLKPIQPNQGKKIVIVGGGLAGCATAYFLRNHGMEVHLLEESSRLASNASGNAQGVLFPLVGSVALPATQFYWKAYALALELIHSLRKRAPFQTDTCGMLFLPRRKREAEKWPFLPEKMGLSPNQLRWIDDPSAVAGIHLPQGGLYFGQGTWVHPGQLCDALLKESGAVVHYNVSVGHLQKREQWELYDKNGEAITNADVVVLTNAFHAADLLADGLLGLVKVKGQVTQFQEQETTRNLRTILAYGGYLLPSRDGLHMLGSTFEPEFSSEEETLLAHEKNLELLQEYVPLQKEAALSSAKGRVSFRAVSFDRLPFIGPVVDDAFMRENYEDLHHGKHWKKYTAIQYKPDLYINAGHGSRGLLSCLYGGYMVADFLKGRVDTFATLTHTSRFLINQLKRKGEGCE